MIMGEMLDCETSQACQARQGSLQRPRVAYRVSVAAKTPAKCQSPGGAASAMELCSARQRESSCPQKSGAETITNNIFKRAIEPGLWPAHPFHSFQPTDPPLLSSPNRARDGREP